MSEIMGPTRTRCVHVQHGRRETRAGAHTCAFLNTSAQPQEIWMERIMKLLLTRFTYDPLSITQMDTTFCY